MATAAAITSMCLHCGRPIRAEARAYAGNGGFYHYECTEPVVGVTISRVALDPGDVAVVHVDRVLSHEQRQALTQAIKAGIPDHRVLVLDGGVKLSVLSQQQIAELAIRLGTA